MSGVCFLSRAFVALWHSLRTLGASGVLRLTALMLVRSVVPIFLASLIRVTIGRLILRVVPYVVVVILIGTCSMFGLFILAVLNMLFAMNSPTMLVLCVHRLCIRRVVLVGAPVIRVKRFVLRLFGIAMFAFGVIRCGFRHPLVLTVPCMVTLVNSGLFVLCIAAMLSVSRRRVSFPRTRCMTVCFMGPLSPPTSVFVLFVEIGPFELYRRIRTPTRLGTRHVFVRLTILVFVGVRVIVSGFT